jgi:hypothetical protein
MSRIAGVASAAHNWRIEKKPYKAEDMSTIKWSADGDLQCPEGKYIYRSGQAASSHVSII